MAFHETLFPTEISYGTSAGPGFNTSVLTTDGGHEYRNPRWTSPRRMYNVAQNVKKDRDLAVLLSFYLARKGAENGFRFLDWSDYTTGEKHTGKPSFTDQPLQRVDSSGSVYQLEKRYVDDIWTHVREITKPVADTVRIGLNGTEITEGFTVDGTTGKVTFTNAPEGSLTWGGEFHVPVRFAEEIDRHFEVSLDDFQTGSLSVPLKEIRSDDSISYEDYFYGGASKHPIEDAFAVSLGDGRVHVAQPMVSGLFATLPDIATIPPGGPIFYILNDGPESLELKDADLNTIVTLAAQKGVEVLVSVDSFDNKLWRVL